MAQICYFCYDFAFDLLLSEEQATQMKGAEQESTFLVDKPKQHFSWKNIGQYFSNNLSILGPQKNCKKTF